MKSTALLALLGLLGAPAGAQAWDPYSPWNRNADQQQIRREVNQLRQELRQEAYNMQSQRMQSQRWQNCVNSGATHCGSGAW